jgi:hypothetical protein
MPVRNLRIGRAPDNDLGKSVMFQLRRLGPRRRSAKAAKAR